MNNTQQIHRDFKALYGKLLIPQGFVFKKNAFYRRHADDVLLVVSAFLRHPCFEVTFEVYPFSCAYTAAKEWRALGVDWFMANRAKRRGEIYERCPQDPYAVKMERMFHAFSAAIFPEFNKVVSLDTYMAYDEWFSSSVGWPEDIISDIWVSLQRKDYSAAYKYIRRYLDDNAQRYAERRADGNRASYTKEYEFWMEIANKLSRLCYSEIDRYTQERVDVTSDTCKRLGIVSLG